MRAPLEKITNTQLVKKFSDFYGTEMFITVFTKATISPFPELDESSTLPRDLSF